MRMVLKGGGRCRGVETRGGKGTKQDTGTWILSIACGNRSNGELSVVAIAGE
jgi:hypothetical protein